MSYSPEMSSLSRRGGAFMIEQKDIDKALQRLILRQSGGQMMSHGGTNMPEAVRKASFEGWKKGQLEFARRVARITAMHAERGKAKLTWKHRSIGLLRRLALLTMVTSIFAAQYM